MKNPDLDNISTTESCHSDDSDMSFMTAMSGISTTSTTSSRSKKFFCDYDKCHKAFTRPSLLTEHQLSVHQGVRPFQCVQCDKTFVRKSHLERHLISHLDDSEKPFHCQHCQKGCTTAQQLKRHEITHSKTFICPYQNCNESFYKHPQLRSHILSFHLNKLNCEICHKKFQRPYRLRHHMAKYHDPNNLTPYQCSFYNCHGAFKNWSELQNHIRNDHPKLSCSICAKQCVGENGLQMHMIIHNSDIIIKKNWYCHVCPDTKFIKKNDLYSHYRNLHGDIELPLELQKLDDNTTTTTPNNNNIPKINNYNNIKTDTHVKRILNSKIIKLNSEIKNIQNQVNLQKYMDKDGNNSMKLLLNTIGRKLKCPFNKCYRTFKTQERYDIHIEKHKIHQQKLKKLEQQDVIIEERSNQVKEVDLNDKDSNDVTPIKQQQNKNELMTELQYRELRKGNLTTTDL